MSKSLIWSETELKEFYDFFFKERKVTDVDFLCLMARKKYLSEDVSSKIRLDSACSQNIYLYETILKNLKGNP